MCQIVSTGHFEWKNESMEEKSPIKPFEQATTTDLVQLEITSTYLPAATSPNTRRAYQADINDFLNWGGVLPASLESVIRYLEAKAPETNSRTLIRRVTALRQWHRLQKIEDPTQDPLVKKMLKGIARIHGEPKRQAHALRLKDLDTILETMTDDSPLTTRDRAIVLLGFFGAFRRSELVSLCWEQVEFVSDGMLVHLARSKTDQVGEGALVVIPFGNEKRCPVRALLDWRKASKRSLGAIFCGFTRHCRLKTKAITSHQLNHRIRVLAKKAGLPQAERYSAHSLRRGFATESARLGASMPAIQRHGRWQSTKTVLEYIEAGRQFADSAVNVLFEF